MDVRTLTIDEWGQLLPNSGTGPFHQPEVLSLMDEYEPGELHLLGGFRGQQAVALLPVFVREQYALRFVVSPPPGLSVPWLGPVLMPTSPKQRKRDKLNERFTEEALDELGVREFRTLFGLIGSPEYTDPRPFHWMGMNVEPRYDYVLELGDLDSEEVIRAFSQNLRREIRNGADLDVSVTIEGPDEAERIWDDLQERHAEQGLRYPTPRSFVGDVVDRASNRSRVYVARNPEGEFLSGITLLYTNSESYFWQGGTKSSYDGVSVNSLIHWEIITDILDDPELADVERYHLGNAMNRRIARYKSKFNAEPVVNYEIKSNLMVLARAAYDVRRQLTASAITDRLTNQ